MGEVFISFPKTDRLLFFNSVVAGIYNAAYSSKQTQCKNYLDGQRQFRWDVMQDIKSLEDEITHLYDQGAIPKENIKLDRYVNVPEDASIKDETKETKRAEKQRQEKEKNFSWDEIDKICTNSNGKKESCTVAKKRLGEENKDGANIMSYLKMLGGLAYDSDDDISAADIDEMDSLRGRFVEQFQ
eukprot:gene13500-14903_t